MVLQRGAGTAIWGKGSAGETVTVSFLGATLKTTVAANGEWSVSFSDLPPGGPHRMTINELTLDDVWVGDVWLCSGQSNMELPMVRVTDWTDGPGFDLGNPQIREFLAPCQYRFDGPADDIPNGRWMRSDGSDLKQFSAIAFFFAREINAKYGIPIGLLMNAVGGSPVEAWLSPEFLADYAEQFADYRRCADASYRDGVAAAESERNNAWYADLYARDRVQAEIAAGAATNPHEIGPKPGWEDFQVPGRWAETAIGDISGVVWFRKEFHVPAVQAGQSARLRYGTMNNSDDVWINGVHVGSTPYQYPPRRYDVPEGVLRAGDNVIVVRIVAPEGGGCFVAGKRYRLEFSDAVIDLKGRYQYRVGAEAPKLPGQTFFQYKPTGLRNAILAPLFRYAVTGVIWYQGESNTGKPEEYRALFGGMIEEWRKAWGKPDLPFFFVQLANFMEPSPVCQETGWATLRDAQRRTLELPRTGMVVATDLGEWNDLHPLNKWGVGHRLAGLAFREAYGDARVVASGPVAQKAIRQGSSIVVKFDLGGSPLASGDGMPLRHFAVSGRDGHWRMATATITGEDAVTVASPLVPEPVAVRYAWANTPEGANLANAAGLPASPFGLEA